jgi:3-deoxy-7-phosphoheptulonate synthase
MEHTDNLNIVQFRPLITPQQLKEKYPEDEQVAHLVAQSRRIINAILTNEDKRRIVITGPCSLHDKKATYDYANRLKKLQDKVADKLLLVMRAYFEKPRTTLGWKGMLYDPYLDGSDNIEEGFNSAREILIELGKIGLPCATEFLDPIVPQYIADLISWAAIGARTAESPPNGKRPVYADRIQKRYRRQSYILCRCRQGGGKSAFFPRHQPRRRGHNRRDSRQ